MDQSTAITELLSQKATATPEDQRRIRRQLRALGYRISEQNKEGSSYVVTLKDKPVKTAKTLVTPSPDLFKHGGSPGVMAETDIQNIIKLYKAHGLEERAVNSLISTEYGYGFDLIPGANPETMMNKFLDRWASHQLKPTWFAVIGEPGTIRILLLGPVPAVNHQG